MKRERIEMIIVAVVALAAFVLSGIYR